MPVLQEPVNPAENKLLAAFSRREQNHLRRQRQQIEEQYRADEIEGRHFS